MTSRNRLRSGRSPLRVEVLEDRTTPALIGLEAADVPVSVTGGVDGGGDIAVRADGTGFVVTYESPDAQGGGIFFKRYDANWQLVQGPVAVNTFTTNDQQNPSIGIDPAGNFVIAWQSFGQDAGDSAAQAGIYARRFMANGTAIDGAEFQVNTTTLSQQRDPDVAVNASGQFVVAFRTGVSVATILAQSYAGITVGGSGTPTTVGGEATVKDGSTFPSTAPAVAIDSAGNYIVTYQASGEDNVDGSFGIFLQRMAQNGTPLASEFQVNVTTAGDQQFPDIAMDGSGNFNIVWYSPGIDGSGTAIVMRRFNAAGNTLSGDIQVNTGITLNNQINPHIDATAAGTFLVTWAGEEADGDATGSDVYFKTYNSAGAVLIGDTRINTAGSNDASEDNAVGGINSAGDFVVLFDSGASGTFDTFLRRFGEDADVSFAAASSSGDESSNASIGLARTGAQYVLANVATQVQVTRSGGTATPPGAGQDFTTTFPTTVTFPANGSTSQNLSIAIVDDTTDEPDETINLSIGTVTNGSAVGPATHAYTILDNDTSISIGDASATEIDSGTVAISFTVTLSSASGSTVTVDFATANNTATAGSDYAATSGTLMFTPGQTSQTVMVTVNGDALFEGNESFFVNLTNPTNATIADSQGVGTITDNDAAASVAVVSGNNQSAATSANFTSPLVVEVRNAGGTLVQGVSVVFTAPAVGASAVFSTTTNTITVSTDASGQASTGTFAANGTTGGPYTVTAQATGGTAPATNFSLTNVPPINLSIDDVTATEGDNGTITYTFTVSLDAPADVGGVTFDIATADGTATAGSDYVARALTAQTIAQGQSTYTFDVTVNGDLLNEANETFFVNVTNVTGAAIADGQGVGTITNDDPVPTLSIDDVTMTEGDSGTKTFTFTVSLSALSGQTVTVNAATADGTALAASDYVANTQTLTFAPGVLTQTFTVTVNGDTTFENNETFVVNLSGPTNATIADGQGAGTITNDDTAPTLSIDDVTVSESAGTITFTVTRTGATEVPITVDYATADATAVSITSGPGAPDFTAMSGTLNFGPSLSATDSQTFTVSISNDSVYEAVEQFFANLSNASGATIADGQGVGTITDDDAAPTISIGDVTVSESDGTATFTVTLTGATALPIAVDFATVDGTAVSSATSTPGTPDYASTTRTLMFNPSASATQTMTIAVSLNNDTTNEATEQFVVNLSNPTNSATITDGQGVATITDDDPVPTLSIDDVTMTEGDSGTKTFTFTVSLSALSAQTITVNVATTDGTALAGSDYIASSGTLTFAPGVQTQTFTVTVNGDTVFENNEAFLVNLSGPTNATIADGQGVGTINNDDPLPTVTLSLTGSPFGENGGTAMVTATLSNPSAFPVAIVLAFGGTASGTDYTASDTTIVIAPGDLTGSITLTGQDDTADENDETIVVDVDSVTGGTESGTQQVTATITDDDLPVAVADPFATNEDVPLTAPSVLGNDNAAPGSTVELVGPTTTNGTLTLNPNGTFTYVPAKNFNGTDSFQYQIRNSANEVSNTVTVSLTITAVNDAPSVALAGTTVKVDQDSGPFSQSGFAAFGPGGGADEAGQAPTYTLTNTNPALFSAQPAIAPNGTLTFTPALGASGTATVTVIVTDSGGTANGGKNTGVARTFTITVGAAVPVRVLAPGSAAGRVQLVNPTTGAVVQDFFPFGVFSGGIRVAVADVTGDGTFDVVAAPGSGLNFVAVFDGRTGALVNAYLPFGLTSGGMQVAAGDLDGDGAADIVLAPDVGAPIAVAISGRTGQVIRAFGGLSGPGTGVQLAVGDVVGDSAADVVMNARGLVAVFDGTTGALTTAFSFFPGAAMGVGDLNGDGKGEIVGALAVPGAGVLVMGIGAQGTVVRSYPDPGAVGLVPRQTSALDLTGDRVADLLVSSSLGGFGRLVLIDGATGAIVREQNLFDPLFGFGRSL